MVDGISTFNTGITLFGNIYLDGELEIKNTALNGIKNLSGNLLSENNAIAKLN